MPATYAHYRFGLEVKDALSTAERKVIDKYIELYMIGLHGPDILFYYDAPRKNFVNATGFALHEKPGRCFFENAKGVINNCITPVSQEGALAYAYGVLCHFALDTTCHPYVERYVLEADITHATIETEFDSYLMLKDGITPCTHKTTTHIIPSDKNAKVIQPFYFEISEEQIKKSLQDMISCTNLLLANNPAKRFLVFSIMRLAGVYEQMSGLVLNPKANPLCDKSNSELEKLYDIAKVRAVEFITAFSDFLNDKQSLNQLFEYNFEGMPSSKPTTENI